MAPPLLSSTEAQKSTPQCQAVPTTHPALSESKCKVSDRNGSTLAEESIGDAAKYLTDTRAEDFRPLTPEREKRLRRKIDCWVIPQLFGALTLGAIDKVEIGTASLYGFQEDNQMHGQQYSWVGSILYLGVRILVLFTRVKKELTRGQHLSGYMLTTWLVLRVPPGKLLCTASMLWSVITMLYAACHSWAGFMALRFFMGVMESAIFPSLTTLVVRFYKKQEQPQRNAIIFAYFSSIPNGFFAWVVGYIPNSAPLKKWQYLYLITGSINILYSLLLCLVLPDSPMNARFLTEEEKYWAVKRLASNRTGISNRVWKQEQFREALLDVRIWLIVLFNIAINIPNGVLQNYGTIIISDLGFSNLKASLLTMPFGIVATFGAWFFSYVASLTNRRTIVACAALLLPILGTALVYGLPRSNVAAQMVGLYLMYFYWAPYVVGISLPQANTAGQTKKSVAFSLVSMGYAAGNLIGPQTFISKEAPKYQSGVIAMLVSYCLSISLLLLYFVIFYAENRRTDKKYGRPSEIRNVVEGFADVTDKKQRDFRYTY
ncbi:major facilitator superfamily transporter [Diaporthe helianthi]|uniref:Major facilitator superfamily transporter n=1 Tax=Diaporthe helianthi TaxID=158607 RepID=A0A2P5HFD0_DIAHE|nr:major facilitator superfamily transporter [Diaporthe helianthi]